MHRLFLTQACEVRHNNVTPSFIRETKVQIARCRLRHDHLFTIYFLFIKTRQLVDETLIEIKIQIVKIGQQKVENRPVRKRWILISEGSCDTQD